MWGNSCGPGEFCESEDIVWQWKEGLTNKRLGGGGY